MHLDFFFNQSFEKEVLCGLFLSQHGPLLKLTLKRGRRKTAK